jgi:matrix metalloproteinase-14 (membrane-inserted)
MSLSSVPKSAVKFTTIAGDSYWVYDASQSPKVSSSYPKPTTTNWGGVEGLLDDVLYVNSGYIYFFTNQTYYRYNCATGMVRGSETNCTVMELNR